MKGLRIFAYTLLLCGAAPTARADLNDYMGPREVSVGESLRADAAGASSVTLNPAGLSLTQQFVFQGTYGYRPGDNASAVSVAACDSTVVVPGCIYYNFFTAEPSVGDMSMSRRVHQVGVTASKAITDRILIGVNTKYFDYNSDLAGESNKSGFSFDAGFILRPGDMFSIAGVGYNLIARDTPQYPRALATGVAMHPIGDLTLGFDMLWNLDAPNGQKGGKYSGGAEYFLGSDDRQSGFPLRAGVVYDSGLSSTSMTGGLGYVTRTFGLDVGMRKEVAGGDEFMIQAGLRYFPQ